MAFVRVTPEMAAQAAAEAAALPPPTDEEIEAAVASDPDAAPILTDEAVARMHVRRMGRATGPTAAAIGATDKTREQHDVRINVNQDHELHYWSKRFGVTHDELRAAVKAVGVGAWDVAKRFGKDHDGRVSQPKSDTQRLTRRA